jgi:hypothetical protein
VVRVPASGAAVPPEGPSPAERVTPAVTAHPAGARLDGGIFGTVTSCPAALAGAPVIDG